MLPLKPSQDKIVKKLLTPQLKKMKKLSSTKKLEDIFFNIKIDNRNDLVQFSCETYEERIEYYYFYQGVFSKMEIREKKDSLKIKQIKKILKGKKTTYYPTSEECSLGIEIPSPLASVAMKKIKILKNKEEKIKKEFEIRVERTLEQSLKENLNFDLSSELFEAEEDLKLELKKLYFDYSECFLHVPKNQRINYPKYFKTISKS